MSQRKVSVVGKGSSLSDRFANIEKKKPNLTLTQRANTAARSQTGRANTIANRRNLPVRAAQPAARGTSSRGRPGAGRPVLRGRSTSGTFARRPSGGAAAGASSGSRAGVRGSGSVRAGTRGRGAAGARGGRGGRGRGRGRGGRSAPVTKEDLDKDLDSFLLSTKDGLDRDLDIIMGAK